MLYFIVLAGYVALGLAVLQRKGTSGEDIWYRMAAMLYEWIPHRRQSPREERNKHLYLKKALLLFLAGDVTALALWTGQAMKKQSVGEFLLRNAMGEGSRTEYFTVRGESGEETEAELLVRECRYTDAELEALYEKLLAELKTVALGENEAWELVTKDLVLAEAVEGYPFLLYWESSDMAAVAPDGSVTAKEEEQLVTLSLRAEYFDFEREEIFYIRVCPKGETFAEKVSRVLKEAEEENPYLQEVMLPKEADGEALSFTEKRKDKSGGVFLLGLAGALAVWFTRNSGLQKREGATGKEEDRVSHYHQQAETLSGCRLKCEKCLPKNCGIWGRESDL